MASVVILVAIKCVSLLHSMLTVCGEYKQLVKDFRDFRQTQRTKEQTQKHQDQINTQDRAFPLVRYQNQQQD